MFGATAVIAALFIHLGIFYCSSQLNHEFLIHSIDPIRVVTFRILTVFSAFFFQLCQAYGRFLGEWLLPFNFLKGKKLVALSLEGPSVTGTLGL